MIHCFITCKFNSYITVRRNKYRILMILSHSPSVWHWVWPTVRIITLLLFSWRGITYTYEYQNDNIFPPLSWPSLFCMWLFDQSFPAGSRRWINTLQRSLLWLFLIFTLAQARQNNTLPKREEHLSGRVLFFLQNVQRQGDKNDRAE